MLRARLTLTSAALILVALYPAASRATQVQAGGSIKFHATVTGKAHDSGTITAPIQRNTGSNDDFNGCAIVTQNAAKELLGAQTLEIHVNYAGGVNLLIGGTAPFVPQEIYMRIMHYRANVSTYTYKTYGPVDLSFAMNGHVYGSPAQTTAHVQNGGLIGTVTGLDALRLYPAPRMHPLHGVNLQVSWNCSTMIHTKSQF